MSDLATHQQATSDTDSAIVAEAVAKGVEHMKWSVWASSPEGLDQDDQQAVVKETVDIVAEGILRRMFPDLYADIGKHQFSETSANKENK